MTGSARSSLKLIPYLVSPFRKIDKSCFLSSLNVGLTGALRQYYPYDYYELKTASIDCTIMFKCNNNKCITSHQLCDGFADCSEREDEKNCKAEDFGYSIKLAGTSKTSEGRVEVTGKCKRMYTPYTFVTDIFFSFREDWVHL